MYSQQQSRNKEDGVVCFAAILEENINVSATIESDDVLWRYGTNCKGVVLVYYHGVLHEDDFMSLWE